VRHYRPAAAFVPQLRAPDDARDGQIGADRSLTVADRGTKDLFALTPPRRASPQVKVGPRIELGAKPGYSA